MWLLVAVNCPTNHQLFLDVYTEFTCASVVPVGGKACGISPLQQMAADSSRKLDTKLKFLPVSTLIHVLHVFTVIVILCLFILVFFSLQPFCIFLLFCPQGKFLLCHFKDMS